MTDADMGSSLFDFLKSAALDSQQRSQAGRETAEEINSEAQQQGRTHLANIFESNLDPHQGANAWSNVFNSVLTPAHQESDEDTESLPYSSIPTSLPIDLPDSDKSTAESKLNQADKLQAFIRDFGEYNGEDRGEKEELVADTAAFFYSNATVKGYALFTTYRFMFLAHIPVNKTNPLDSNNNGIIAQGFSVFHRSKSERRRVWLVLKDDSLSGYPASDRLYEPLGSVRLVFVSQLRQHIPGSKSVHFQIRHCDTKLDFETEEAALSWQSDLEVALWHSHHSAREIRISVPMVRITSLKQADYHGFGTMLFFDVGHYDTHIEGHSRSLSNTSTSSSSSTSEERKELLLALPKEVGNDVMMKLEPVLGQARQWRESANAKSWHLVPEALFGTESLHDKTAQNDAKLQEHEGDSSARRSQKMIDLFALKCRPEDVHTFKIDYTVGLLATGTLTIGPSDLCFYRRNVVINRAEKMIKIPTSDIHHVTNQRAFRWHHYGLRVEVNAHSDLTFETTSRKERDEIVRLLRQAIDEIGDNKLKEKMADMTIFQQELDEQRQSEALKLAKTVNEDDSSDNLPPLPTGALKWVPKRINSIRFDTPRGDKMRPIHIVCLTIGSRGDVQPYVALCKSLMKDGHQCTIVSHPEYKNWVNSHGVSYRAAGGDPGLLMKLSVDNKMFSVQFFKETLGKFRDWLDELLREIIEQCSDADLIIESPSTFGGVHVAEALGISYMRAFTMPWTKTASYPQAFSVPKKDMGPLYNSASYAMYDQVIWLASAGHINRWRTLMLGLAPTELSRLNTGSVPFMYNFSPAVVPPPLDWGNRTAVTGYWTLETSADEWEPPSSLVHFLNTAKTDGKKVAYIGFGSITMHEPIKVMKSIYTAVIEAGLRAVVSKGWSSRMEGKEDQSGEEQVMTVPDQVYVVDSIPHDWLFPRIDIAMHHGGAGTTGASLGNGLVTLIHPFFGDQFFWAQRVEKLGAGLCVSSLSTRDIARALTTAASHRLMREKAQLVGSAMKRDTGVETAKQFIYYYYDTAKRTPCLARQQVPGMANRLRMPRRANTLAAKSASSSGDSPDPSPSLPRRATDKADVNEGTTKSVPSSYSAKRNDLEHVRRREALLQKWRHEGREELFERTSLGQVYASPAATTVIQS